LPHTVIGAGEEHAIHAASSIPITRSTTVTARSRLAARSGQRIGWSPTIVTDGIESAIKQAKAVAAEAGKDVALMGGVTVTRCGTPVSR
jgi:hypothetical protein